MQVTEVEYIVQWAEDNRSYEQKYKEQMCFHMCELFGVSHINCGLMETYSVEHTAQKLKEYILDFASHRTGSILQHMGKRLPFPMNIRQKMLGSFRKIQDCLQIDDLCRSRRDRRIQIRQPLQISCL